MSLAESITAYIGGATCVVLLVTGLITMDTYWFFWLVIVGAATVLLASILRAASSTKTHEPTVDRSPSTSTSTDRAGLYDRLEVWLVAEGYDPFAVPQAATHLLIATGRPREITSIAYLHRYAHIIRVGRPIRHVIRPADLPGLDRMPNFPTRLTVEQLAEFDRLTKFELSLEPAA